MAIAVLQGAALVTEATMGARVVFLARARNRQGCRQARRKLQRKWQWVCNTAWP